MLQVHGNDWIPRLSALALDRLAQDSKALEWRQQRRAKRKLSLALLKQRRWLTYCFTLLLLCISCTRKISTYCLCFVIMLEYTAIFLLLRST
jgi:hypothetical protein